MRAEETCLTERKSICVVRLTNWLDWASGTGDYRVMLPMLQRGSVWRPSQVIELWDSLLREMPVGAMLVGPKHGDSGALDLINPITRAMEEVSPDKALELIDGQQRTIAMLIGWFERSTPLGTRREEKSEQRARGPVLTQRVWIDMAAKPTDGLLLRYRYTSLRQPYGTKQDDPNGRLGLSDRRLAREIFFATHPYFDLKKAIDPGEVFEGSLPFGDSGIYVPLDLFVKEFRMRATYEQFSSRIQLHLASSLALTKNAIERLVAQREPEGLALRVIKYLQRQSVSVEAFLQGEQAVLKTIYEHLAKLKDQELPIIPINENIMTSPGEDKSKPLLAVLFHRIGNNFTKLSNEDYVFAVLKHRKKEFHGYVERLMGSEDTIISATLTPSELAVCAVRLANAAIDSEGARPESDAVIPEARVLDRWLGNESLNKELNRLIGIDDESGLMEKYFEQVHRIIRYRQVGDSGLPLCYYPYLQAPLIHVLLRLAQKELMKEDFRDDILRLIMFWTVSVTDAPKASLKAFREIAKGFANDGLFNCLYMTLTDENAALRWFTPSELEKVPGLVDACGDRTSFRRLEGGERFSPQQDALNEQRLFYKRWWAGHTHVHPILLWLQRDYVASEWFSNEPPSAGLRWDELSYDYDHILPSAHWGDFRGSGLPQCLPRDRVVVGNGLGNVRVWNMSDNRSDGDKLPVQKLGLDSAESLSAGRDLLADSAVCREESEFWKQVSLVPTAPESSSTWDVHRAWAFQRAVETRTFNLYKMLWAVIS